MKETGLYDKLLEAGFLFGYKIYHDLNTVFDEERKENYMELDEIKIAVGPYLVGIWLAIMSLIIERSIQKYLPVEQEIVTKERFKTRRRTQAVFKKTFKQVYFNYK